MSHVGKKRKLDKSRQDRLYFDSYTDVTIHEEMIADHVRTGTYRTAIMRNSESIRGKVVLDVGAGTGVLSMFCVQAGAKKVYAVEACSIAEQAVKIVKHNNMEDKIEVIRGTVETVDLPEPVDVIVSEWMGYALLHESMLNSVLYARDKWLRNPGGLILPSRAELYIAPMFDLVVEDRLHFWYTVKDQYGVDMSCMHDFAKKCIMNSDIAVNPVTVEDVLSHPARFAELDLDTITTEELREVKGQFRCSSFGCASVNSFCVWFTVSFPCPDKQPVVLSTSPFKPETHWKQAVLYLDHPENVVQDTAISGEVRMYPSEHSDRHICIHLDYTVGEQKRQSKSFSIPDWSAQS